jgi:hypothetical protein
MQGGALDVQREPLRRRHSGIRVALALQAFFLAVSLGYHSGRCSAAVPAALQSPQEDEEAYYKNAYTIIDLPFAEVLADIPQLRGLEPASSQKELPTILRKVGTTVQQLYQSLPSVAADERITQEKCDYDGRARSTTHHDFGYLIIVNHDEPVATLQEYRTDAQMKPVESTGVGQGFTFTKDFGSMWLLFYPSNQSECHFRYLGEQTLNGRDLDVVAFAERPGEVGVKGHVNAGGRSALLLYQGVAWIDVTSFRITRLRLDLLEPRLDLALERMTTDVQFGEVRVPGDAATFWLPREVTVTTIYGGQMYRNRHLYLDFRRFVVHSKIGPAGTPQTQPPN